MGDSRSAAYDREQEEAFEAECRKNKALIRKFEQNNNLVVLLRKLDCDFRDLTRDLKLRESEWRRVTSLRKLITEALDER